MFRGIVQIDNFLTLSNQAHQTFAGLQRHMADRFCIQAFRRHEQITLIAFVEEIDRADINLHGLGHMFDHDVERFMQTGGRIDLLNNTSQGVQLHIRHKVCSVYSEFQ